MKHNPSTPKTPRLAALPAALAAAFALALSLQSPALFAAANRAPAVSLRVDLDRSVLAADTTEKAIVKICLDGVRLPRPEARQPVNLAIVLDRSSSMRGERIERAKDAALEALQRLAPDDILSLVVYDSTAEVLVPARRVGDGRAIAGVIRSINVTGMTALHDGVVLGGNELRKNIEDPRYVHRIMLLSDGQANRGPRTPEALGQLGEKLAGEGISVTTIGVGLGYNEDLMTRLALRSDGNTWFAESGAALPRIFAAELGDVLNVVARRAVIRVEFPDGIRPLALVGRQGSIDGRRAEIPLGQIYGGQEKFALVEVEVSPTRAGAEREIARARITCEDIAAQRTVELAALGRARFSADPSAVIASANHQVQADFAANRTAEVKDKAIELIDAGHQQEAAQLLRWNSRYMDNYGKNYDNRAVRELSAKNDAEAEIVELSQFSVETRKQFRTDNANTVNQQNTSSSSVAPVRKKK
ncbi:MAG: VWA domain-containing protein [Opitutaceae bacterium]|jgi:Ca-activated chloride channel family protein|nr:VWA domain-containing protein [Opitutaceae bacterium]